MGPARQIVRQPRHESGRAGAKSPWGSSSKLGRLVGRGRPPRLTYRVTQVLTGHGCFGEYLHQVPARWSTIRRGCDRAATSSWKSDGTSRRRWSSRHCWWAREGEGPWPPSVSRLCFGKRQRRGWGCGTPTPRGSAADALRRGALGPPRSPVIKLRRW